MDRNREARRASSIVGSNGFNRRRHRTNSLRDSPDDDGGVELQESIRLRDRVKKDRDRDRERERERERERSSRNKRRRAERLMSREDITGDETSEESVNDEEDEEDEEPTSTATASPAVRMVVNSLPNHHHHSSHHQNNHNHTSSVSQQHLNNNNNNNSISSSSNHHHQHQHHLQHRKSYPPPTSTSSKEKEKEKLIRAPPVWKAGDEMISVSVPRKARSASTKRSHDWISGGGVGGGEQSLRQASSSPVRQGLATATATASASAQAQAQAPVSPSSSNVSMRKKLKPSGNPKLKPPKAAVVAAAAKPSASTPEELEIEIAEVLYGLMTQSTGPSSSTKKEDSKEANRSSGGDAKSRVSSPISNSASVHVLVPGSGPSPGPLSVVAPKRKRPRQVVENSVTNSNPNPNPNPIHGARVLPVSAKAEGDQALKVEVPSPKMGSAAENGFESVRAAVSGPDSVKSDSETKPVVEEMKDVVFAKEELKEKESGAVGAENSNRVDPASTATATAVTTATMTKALESDVENQREEKFEIDLMAPPPQGRSSPEREVKVDLSSAAVDQKPVLVDAELKLAKDKEKEEEKVNVGIEDKKVKVTEEGEGTAKGNENKGRNIDLRLDLEKDGVNAAASSGGNKLLQAPKQQQVPLKANKEEPIVEKSGQSTTNSLPLPMSMAAWPGGLPPMGYMAPLQGVVSMDGTPVAPPPIQPPFSQPRPKRCATHCYIAKSIHYLQQLMKMNPFWPAAAAAAGSASLFGSKPCNLNVNVMPAAADLHANIAVRGVVGNNNGQDNKGPSLSNLPSNNGGKDKGSQPTSTQDPAQRKQHQQQQQILIQQALPPVAPSSLLGPAFIFPLNQQQAAVAAAASVRPNAGKSSTPGGVSSSNTSSSSTASPSGPAAAMSFNYPNMGPNETQYLAILQNNAYPFPIPAVGAPPNFRGTPAQAMPLFNGLYSSPMIHPSQLQPPSNQPQAHQNASVSTGGSSSSQKHQQQRPQTNGAPGNGNLQNFPAPQAHSQHMQHSSRPRHLENEINGGEDSPSTDSRGSRASVNIYGQNFAMPIHPQNFALISPQAAMASAANAQSGNNQSDKKPQQKTGAESLPPHSFAMSFGPINGATGPGIDLTTMAQNHAIFQSFPEAARHNIQMMAAAAQAAQKKNMRISEDGKSGGGDSSANDDDRKSLPGKSQAAGAGQSIAFGRSDMGETPVTSIQGNSAIENSGRSLNVGPGPARSSRPMTNANSVNVQNAQYTQQQIFQQLKQQQQQHQQLQQQMAANAAASRNKVQGASNGSIYPEHLANSAISAKFPNPLSGFPQNFVQSNSNSATQSPQWKNSSRTTPTSQAPSSLASSTVTTLKNLPQQQSRTQAQMHTQISFGGNQKPSNPSSGQAPPASNQAPSPPLMVGSPTTSSISKGASGSPRTNTSGSTNNKIGPGSSLSAQQAKNSSSVPSQKTPSILGNPHVVPASSAGGKTQMQQQQQQQQHQQVQKSMQQAQLFFSSPYSQAQSHSTTSSTTSGPSGYYVQQRRWPEQHQQQPGGANATSSTGMLSLCPPVTLSGAVGTNDPAKAMAAATCNVKGGGLPSQGVIHAAQFAAAQSAGALLPAGFSYVHPVPAAVQVKPTEQKQPAGNDNLHPWQPEKK